MIVILLIYSMMVSIASSKIDYFFLFESLRQLFKLKMITWSFFASAHRKGPCDGICGHIKRKASKTSYQ
jgi:hypothetical protein